MDSFRGCCHNADCDGFENCDDCWNDYKANRKMTNADLIRSMSDEELAIEIHAFTLGWRGQSDWCDYGCEYPCENGCDKCILKWLKHPAKEDA